MIKNLLKRKRGGLQRTAFLLVILLILILPLGIYALENSTDSSTGNVSNSEQPLSETPVEESQLNESINTTETNETNILQPNITANKTLQPSPETPEKNGSLGQGQIPLKVQVIHPEKITRGENLILKVEIVNLGELDFEEISIEIISSKGFESLEKKYIELLQAGGNVTQELEISSSKMADLGLNEIKVLVNYNE